MFGSNARHDSVSDVPTLASCIIHRQQDLGDLLCVCVCVCVFKNHTCSQISCHDHTHTHTHIPVLQLSAFTVNTHTHTHTHTLQTLMQTFNDKIKTYPLM